MSLPQFPTYCVKCLTAPQPPLIMTILVISVARQAPESSLTTISFPPTDCPEQLRKQDNPFTFQIVLPHLETNLLTNRRQRYLETIVFQGPNWRNAETTDKHWFCKMIIHGNIHVYIYNYGSYSSGNIFHYCRCISEGVVKHIAYNSSTSSVPCANPVQSSYLNSSHRGPLSC